MTAFPTSLALLSSRSLLAKLLHWTLISLLLLTVLASGMSFWRNYEESADFQKDNLKNIAILFALKNTATANYEYHQTDDDGQLRVEVWQGTHTASAAASVSNTPTNLDDNSLTWQQAQQIPEGFSRQTFDDETWQVYRLDKSHTTVIVRQDSDFQDELAQSSAIQSMLYLLAAMLIFSVILAVILWRAFRPLQILSQQIAQRDSQDLSPLPPTQLPSEIIPFVTAINQLLDNAKANIARQQRFIADASHELRSPLAATSLQLQRLQRLPATPAMQTGLDKLSLRVKRNQDLVEQLLTLARLNAHQPTQQAIKLYPIIEQVMNLLLPIIADKRLEPSIEVLPELKHTTVIADDTAVLLLIKNLLQNAVIYTPPHGKIAIVLTDIAHCDPVITEYSQRVVGKCGAANRATRLHDFAKNQVIVQIVDTGVGIDPSDYAQAFEPFVRLSQSQDNGKPAERSDSVTATASPPQETAYHTKGTGLGLAMVKTICEQLGIALFLSPSHGTVFNTSENEGICVSLVLPIQNGNKK